MAINGTIGNRRLLLRLGGIVVLSPFARAAKGLAAADSSQSGFVSVADIGAIGDGMHDDGTVVTQYLKRNPNAKLLFPPGRYFCADTVVAREFGGHLAFQTGARLEMGNLDNPGLYLGRASGARIQGITIGFSSEPDRRRDRAPAIMISRSVDVTIEECTVLNASGAGILFDECTRPKLSNAKVAHTRADGIHFANCLDGSVSDAVTEWTGDDGVAFVNYRHKPEHGGGQALRVSVRNSRARGIAVVGQSGVEIRDFNVDTTSSNGIYCAFEEYFKTRVPYDVRFSNGKVMHAGMLTPRKGTQFGIAVADAGSVSFVDIETRESFNRGVSVLAPLGEVVLRRIKVASPGASNGVMVSARKVEIEELDVDSSQSYGVWVGNCEAVVARHIRVRNVSRGDPLERAVWFESNRAIEVNGVEVIDTEPNPRRNIVGFIGEQKGVVRDVKLSDSKNRAVVVMNKSRGVVVER